MSALVPAARARPRSTGLVMTVVLAVAALLWFSPLVILLLTGLRTAADFLAHGPLSWPAELTLANFPEAWETGGLTTTYRNSILITVVKVPLGVLLSAMLAFALAKLQMRFRATILFTVLLGLTIPIYISIVPLFGMLRTVGLTDNLAGLIGPYLAFGIPFEVLVLYAFFRRLPDEIIVTPSVVPMTRGRLQFEWHRGNRSLELEFESIGRIHYLKADDDSVAGQLVGSQALPLAQILDPVGMSGRCGEAEGGEHEEEEALHVWSSRKG